MELDFSDRIKELLKSKNSTVVDSAIIAEDKIEKTYSECNKSMSECESKDEKEDEEEDKDSENEDEMEEDDAKSRKRTK